MILQYSMLIFIPFSMFVAISALLIPIAWVSGILTKAKSLRNGDLTKNLIDLIIFIFFGVGTLSLNIITDSFYFIKLMFRTNLKTITTEKAQSDLVHRSLRQIISLSRKY